VIRIRRAIALVATFAVLGTALWPLVASWMADMRHESVPLCHQAGLQVAADSMPMPDSPGEGNAPQSHCPLCVLVFFAAFAPSVAAPPYVAIAMIVERDRAPAPFERRFTVVLPGSRAPPVAFA
jgi:MFS family permease